MTLSGSMPLIAGRCGSPPLLSNIGPALHYTDYHPRVRGPSIKRLAPCRSS